MNEKENFSKDFNLVRCRRIKTKQWEKRKKKIRKASLHAMFLLSCSFSKRKTSFHSSKCIIKHWRNQGEKQTQDIHLHLREWFNRLKNKISVQFAIRYTTSSTNEWMSGESSEKKVCAQIQAFKDNLEDNLRKQSNNNKFQ